jgi:hypothetical protein
VVILLLNTPLIHRLLLGGSPSPVLSLPYQEGFSSAEVLERHFWTLGGGLWRVVGGTLLSPGVRNNRLWLLAALPRDVVVEFDARTSDANGSIRVELFGDGLTTSSRSDGRSQSRGYILSHEAAGSPQLALSRLDEAAPLAGELARSAGLPPDTALGELARLGHYAVSTPVRVVSPAEPLEPNRWYRWRLERRGSTLSWFIDGQRRMVLEDPFPLQGRGHDRFGFTSLDNDVLFDNLSVRPLKEGEQPSPTTHEALRPAPSAAATLTPVSLRPEAWLATAPQAVRWGEDEVVLSRARNHPLWWRTPLPREAVVELTAWSESPDGDIKLELWGDGASHAPTFEPAPHVSTGYVFILGGWRNSRSIIARRDEHGVDVVGRSDWRVEPHRRYALRIERKGARLTLDVDGVRLLAMTDASPLEGEGHRFLGLSGWDTTVHFSQVRVGPLAPAP